MAQDETRVILRLGKWPIGQERVVKPSKDSSRWTVYSLMGTVSSSSLPIALFQ